jgi:hypothetical protein
MFSHFCFGLSCGFIAWDLLTKNVYILFSFTRHTHTYTYVYIHTPIYVHTPIRKWIVNKLHYMVFLSVCTGFLIDFISTPVTSGFTSAYSLIIIVSQLKSLFGLRKFKTKGFIDNISKLIAHLHETKIWDTALGIFCIIFLLILRVSFSQ